jgi:hypothetical protein
MMEPKDTTADAIDINKYHDNWPKIFEHLDDWIGQHYGPSSKAPLLYLCRGKECPPDEQYDPSSNYESIREELIARCPIWVDWDEADPNLRPDHYETENAKLWEALQKVFQATPSYQYMKAYAKGKDGRNAYLALKAHYLGPNNANNLAQATSTKLDQLRYTGENRRWNMQRYVTAHVECYNILEGLKEHGFSGMDEPTRVRKFIAGIRTDKLAAVESTVLANPTLSFDRVTRLYRDHVALRQSMHPAQQEQRQVSDVRVSEAKADVEDRYYTADEYRKLSADQKYSLKKKRERRGGGKRGDGRKPKPFRKTQQAKHNPFVKAAIKAATRKVAAMQLGDEDTTEESEMEEEMKPPSAVKQGGSNRGHPALAKKQRVAMRD